MMKRKIILGICNAETASACIMINGEVIFAASEERFSRIKLDNSFPTNAIQECLSFCNIDISDINIIAYSLAKRFNEDQVLNYVNLGSRYSDDKVASEIVKQRVIWEISRDKKKRLEFDIWAEENINSKYQKIYDFYHHEAHAASASLLSPFNKGYIFTSDGRGDFESATIYKFDRYGKNQLQKIYSATSSESFGYFFGRITGLLGFKPMRHEGKITGLAAFGNPNKALDLCKRMIEIKEGKVIAHLGDFFSPFFSPYSEFIKEKVKNYRREDIAAAAQAHLENMMKELISYYLRKNNEEQINLMCAGGVFGNVKVTQKLKELKEVKNCYVQPHMGDGGLCLGACALANEKIKEG